MNAKRFLPVLVLSFLVLSCGTKGDKASPTAEGGTRFDARNYYPADGNDSLVNRSGEDSLYYYILASSPPAGSFIELMVLTDSVVTPGSSTSRDFFVVWLQTGETTAENPGPYPYTQVNSYLILLEGKARPRVVDVVSLAPITIHAMVADRYIPHAMPLTNEADGMTVLFEAASNEKVTSDLYVVLGDKLSVVLQTDLQTAKMEDPKYKYYFYRKMNDITTLTSMTNGLFDLSIASETVEEMDGTKKPNINVTSTWQWTGSRYEEKTAGK